MDGETVLASRMWIVGDGGTDGAIMVVSFAGVLGMALACWKAGSGSTGNYIWVYIAVGVRCL